jgi:peptide/nickel transport system substrate-binding protein
VPWNDTAWCDETFDNLLLTARAELDEAKRRQMYFDMQEMVANQGGTVIPMFASNVCAVNDKIAIPEKTASNWTLDGQRWMERWSMA